MRNTLPIPLILLLAACGGGEYAPPPATLSQPEPRMVHHAPLHDAALNGVIGADAEGLIRQFGELFDVEAEWRWNGRHYQRTAQDWLANYDRHEDAIGHVLRDTYGADAALWRRRWRLFFLATAGLFGYADGSEWGVSH